jgi:hypothetical protein
VKRVIARRPVGLFILGLFVIGCASIVGLDGYDDAVTLLCQCPGFESITDCVDGANKRLAFASDSERQVWLEGFQSKHCGTVCDRADECYGDVPVCREKRNGCECCSWNSGKLLCTTGTCEICRTCSEIVVTTDSGSDCVTGQALYRDLRQCACTQCASQCSGFCQGTSKLSSNGSNACNMCLAGACSDSMTACTADKP